MPPLIWPGAGPFPATRLPPVKRTTGRSNPISGKSSCTASPSLAPLNRIAAIAGASFAKAAGAAAIVRARATAGASSATAKPTADVKRSRQIAGTATASAAPVGAITRKRPLAGSSSATAAPAGTISLVRSINVVVDFTAEDVNVSQFD